MADAVTVVGIKFQTGGDAQVTKAFKKLSREVGGLKRDFGGLSDKSLRKVRQQLLGVSGATRNSINSMQAQRNALQGLRNMADVTGLEFKQLTKDISLLDAKMRQAAAGGGAGGLKGRLKGFAKGAGAIAAGGIFGGPEGALGGAIGLSVGGPAGAAVGAAIGAQVGMVRQQLSGITEFSAELALQRKALKLVIGDTNKFNNSQKFLLKTSRSLAIPQSIITRQFTSLTASVVGAGKSVSDAEEVFKAIAAGIRGTGGSLEDMKSAMRATAQVFSKGKVSAEELRQQLGERLPGAFTLFADSMGKTPAELDKALEQGKVTLDDFMKFAKTLFATYGENAEILAQGPEAAGDRLRTSLEELNDDLGALLRPIGVQFQKLSEDIIKSFGGIVKAFRQTVEGIVKEREMIKELELTKNERQKINTQSKDKAVQQIKNTVITQEDIDNIIKNTGFRLNRKSFEKSLQNELGKTFGEVRDGFAIFEKARGKNLFDVTREIRRDAISNMFTQTGTDAQGRDFDDPDFNTGPISTVTEDTPEIDQDKTLNGIQRGAQQYFDTIKSFAEETGAAVNKAFKGMEDAIVNFVLTGKLNFRSFAQSVIADMTRVLIRQKLLAPLLSGFLKTPVPVPASANGNVFARNGIVPYAKGGIVNKPQLFPFSRGIGLMGEAGPEAILPLQRGRGGKLGVIAQGSNVGNITVNVDASGSSVEGQDNQSQELGNLLGAAIQAELIRQKRPGGLLG